MNHKNRGSPDHVIDFERSPVLRAIDRLVRPGMIAFDIGANRGDTAQALSEAGAIAYAFEPIPSCADEIRTKNLSNVFVIESAVSDEEGVAIFHLDRREGLGMQGSSLLKLDGFQGEATTVPVTTLDKFVETRELIPEFIKLDVEGVEERVLTGGKQTILRHRPILVFEVWGYNWPRFADVIAWLEPHYRFECASDGAEALVRYNSSLITENDDVICLPR
jgi:FkbM family methyltransferase